MFYENLCGFVLVQTNKQSTVNSSDSERYLIDNFCWWFVNSFYSEN